MRGRYNRAKTTIIKTIAALLLLSLLIPGAGRAEESALAVTVDLGGERKAISPYIYGVNSFYHEDALGRDVTAFALRQGGNRMTAYNWENNASNAGSDWNNYSDGYLTASDAPGEVARMLCDLAASAGIGYKITTLQMAGYAAADKNGEVTQEETAPSDRWDRVQFQKSAPFSLSPDLLDQTVYMDEYVNFLVQTFGDASTPGGIQGYSLDNEPSIWYHSHRLVHPSQTTVEELAKKSAALAAAVKAVDPAAEIYGPALYGFSAYERFSDNENSTGWKSIKARNGYRWYIDCYLDQMRKESGKRGVRLLDVLDIHYYSESARSGPEDRVQSVRTLYEKGFVENSWIGQWWQSYIPILPTIRQSIDMYYPGTKIAVTEYNFGGEDDPSGAIAQVEALGCFAEQGVYFASLWVGKGFIFSGMNLYTNYDGQGAAFGNQLIPASSPDVSVTSAYAAIQDGDLSQVTLTLTNKRMDAPQPIVIRLENAQSAYTRAEGYAVYGDSTAIRPLEGIEIRDNGAVYLTLPPFSAAIIIVK